MRRGPWPLATLVVGLGGWLLPGCGHETRCAPDAQDSGKPLFDVTWHNEAWGYQLSGWWVDDAGRLFRFDHGDARWASDADTLPEADLREKFARGRELVALTGTDDAICEP